MFGLYWQLPSCLEALNHYLWWIIDHVHFRKILIKIGSRFFLGGGISSVSTQEMEKTAGGGNQRGADLRRCFVWVQTNKWLNKQSAISFYYRQPQEKFCAGMKSGVTPEVSASLAEVHEATERPSRVTSSHSISRRCTAQLLREGKWKKHSASYFPQLIFVCPFKKIHSWSHSPAAPCWSTQLWAKVVPGNERKVT